MAFFRKVEMICFYLTVTYTRAVEPPCATTKSFYFGWLFTGGSYVTLYYPRSKNSFSFAPLYDNRKEIFTLILRPHII